MFKSKGSLKVSMSDGLPCEGLNSNQLQKLQRFIPNFIDKTHFFNETSSVFSDTNGFFIAKFYKNLE
jgi:hypothetical protein